MSKGQLSKGELSKDEMSGSGRPLVARLHARLADGAFHSGEALAGSLGVSRSAVWKAAGALRELGVTLDAVPNRGYRMRPPCEPLDAAAIERALDAAARGRVARLDVEWSVGSTNAELLARPSPRPGTTEVLLAEHQSAGRGRRGRSWLAAPGGSLCLSMSWLFVEAPRDLGSLSLAIGVAARRALAGVGARDVQLKWPNDLLVAERKLGGILIELRAEAGGPAYVVVGIGVNCALGTGIAADLAAAGAEPADLAAAGADAVSRNVVAAALVSSIAAMLVEFERAGAAAFLDEWQQADALCGSPVTVHTFDGERHGIARGIDADGALRVETAAGIERFVSGEVTLRAVRG